MATRLFWDEELERLREFPEIIRDELYRYFTLTPADIPAVAVGRRTGSGSRSPCAPRHGWVWCPTRSRPLRRWLWRGWPIS